MADFPHVHRDRVRFRDCDAMGHVNNAVYSTYLGASIPVPDGLRERLAPR